MKRRKHVGSSFDKWLEEEGIRAEVDAAALKTVLAWHVEQGMGERKLSKSDMARAMRTSRAALDRLLDPKNESVTLRTMARAARALGKRLRLELSAEACLSPMAKSPRRRTKLAEGRTVKVKVGRKATSRPAQPNCQSEERGTSMEFGIILPGLDASRCRDLAQAAEGLGYDLITFPDHLVQEGYDGQYDPHSLLYDPFAIAATVADATKKIRIGHLVLCNLFRHPAIMAQSLVTLDHISGGRVVVGLGAGWTETEFQMTGIPFPSIGERLEMLDEAIQCMLSLWSNERTSFEGRHYRLHDAILWPKPVQKPYPPILLGGSGNGLLRIAAKYADYVNIAPPVGKRGRLSIEDVKRVASCATFRERVNFVHQEARRVRRDPQAIRISAIVTPTITDSAAVAQQTLERLSQQLNLSPDTIFGAPFGVMVGTPEQCVVKLRRFAKELNISQVVFHARLAGIDEKLMRRLREEIIAHV
ncbi:MAG: LLM class flavin-dependent oxidoreductase [Deltaproteobacteria bacterium]|nr:LLM class flavin-dependent oxidoreductase [Deltaproteobacteria bacterium]